MNVRLLASVLLIPTLMGARAVADPALDLRIGQSERQRGEIGHYVDSRRIPIQITVTNPSSEPREIVLKDHDQAGYPMAVPEGLQVRLVGDAGQVLSKHRIGPGILDEEWWTSAYLRSTVCSGATCEMPGDRILLAPGDVVRRVTDLATMVSGAPLIPRALAPGRYIVRMRLGDLVSNDFTVVIEGATDDLRRAP